jgi:hypothetical protein
VFQWLLCQLVLLLNTAYILTAKPYSDPDNAMLDRINCAFLLAICVLTATYSVWNTDTFNRFFYGILFDAVVVLQFIVNMVYVVGQVVTSLLIKFTQMRLRYKQRKNLVAIKKLRAREAADYAFKVDSLEEKTNALSELKSQAAKLRNEHQ